MDFYRFFIRKIVLRCISDRIRFYKINAFLFVFFYHLDDYIIKKGCT